MRNVAILVVALAAIGFAAKPVMRKLSGGDYGSTAKARVEAVLQGAQPKEASAGGPTTDTQVSICQYAIGKGKGCDVYRETDLFDIFRREKDVFVVNTYEITDVTVTSEETGGKSAIVRCRINGKPLEMVVTEGERLKWKG